MECVAITVGGYGSAWLFKSQEEAELHPLIQPGDAIVANRVDMFKQYMLFELDVFLGIIGDDTLKQRVLSSIPQRGSAPERLRVARVDKDHGAAMWAALLKSARPVPRDPAEIMKLIRQDRLTWKEVTMAKKAQAAAAGGAPKAAKAPAEKKVRAREFPDDHVISMQNDKDGKPYGKDNNPKRAGTNAATAFAKYKDGMTVGAFLKAGGSLADLRNDTGKKFIKIAAAA